MKQEPRPVIHLGSSLGGPISWAESLGISKAGQTVLVLLMEESQIWHQLAGSVGGGFRKGTMASVPLEVRHFSPPSIPLVPFKLLPHCLSSKGVSLSWVCVDSLRGTAWGSRSFFH